ncbi:MAG: 1-acyl-sn-glycerol-3-phosphate acyltransferase [Burkholderiaceae bacterium]|nr:MAG: 1-acyl-sn-glycerol-3-phosphate acyltransferase [Burkholderiaceae bacterium]MBE7426911.1 1-acyl-sn-glycerol-3-phosphate acyltransferase [Ideonella sp.]MCC7288176.1 1-acyl-sn-glycerol-3-phosphate acyltransferase [Burkholderiaceae bacterium]
MSTERLPARAWPQPLGWLGLQGLLLCLGLMSIAWNLVALVLYPLLPRATGLRIGRAGISRGYRMFWALARASGLLRMDAAALQPLADERGLMIVANHPSLLDALMLVAQLPLSACVMKAGLARNPLLGPGARLARYIRNDSPHRMLQLAIADLRGGGQLVMFPEGTRTTQAPLNAFQGGFALIAQRAAVPVQTVFIDTASPYLGKGWPLWRLPPLPIEFSVRLGRRFAVGPDVAQSVREIERYMAAGVAALPRQPPP